MDEVTFTVQPGELVSVLGPNGAGKTTLVKMMTGLLLPEAGSIRLDGHDVVKDRRRAAMACGFSLGGDTGLYPRLTARQNLVFFGNMYALRGDKLEARVGEMLRSVDLEDRAKDLVGSFSRGMKQRLHLARSLMHDPPILILDEPSAGLDPQSAASMRNLVDRLSNEGRSILLTTHDMREAEELSDRIILMKAGRVQAESTASELRLGAAERMGNTVQVVFVNGDIPEEPWPLPGILSMKRDGATVTLRAVDGAAAVRWVLDRFPNRTASVSVTPPTLEEVFLEMAATS
ncbi:ABC transporter ATP-binding protein [Actinoplanes sp. ATCC 53533]|uniref:ABC transporter ATP-binding protein n=1 Tax=Actinoplanes sp. ATCC 53533 TaxID=1288362 RepID=UPI001F282BB1|nr:ABC transporter ATP-binding protein [Actinoplanes sp. ATCC 53533]